MYSYSFHKYLHNAFAIKCLHIQGYCELVNSSISASNAGFLYRFANVRRESFHLFCPESIELDFRGCRTVSIVGAGCGGLGFDSR